MQKQLIDVDSALKLNRSEVADLYKSHVNPAFAKLQGLLDFDKQFVRAEGTTIWDSEGNKYLDFMGGFGAINLGHNPPAVLEAVQKVLDMPNILKVGLSTMESVAAHNLSQLTPGELSNTFFCNSGTEAVEGAVKTARIASGKQRVIYCQNSFHGKTMGSLSVTGRGKYQKPFQPLVPGNEKVPFGDLEQLKLKLKAGNVAAFIVEPIQGEGGILLPPEGYLRGARKLCDEYDTYFILDEIQTGFGRTGKLFACEYEEVVPDFICLAKSLGGGVMPIGAFITTQEIWNNAYGSIDKALLHTSTFGGNVLATTAATAAMNEYVSKDLSQQTAEKGEYFITRLRTMVEKYELVKEVRGQGLLIGVEFSQPDSKFLDKISRGMIKKLSQEYVGSLVAGSLLNEHGIVTAYTLNNPNVIRLEPPLIVTYEEIDRVLAALEDIFSKNTGLFSMALSNAKSVLGSLFK